MESIPFLQVEDRLGPVFYKGPCHTLKHHGKEGSGGYSFLSRSAAHNLK